ncbi:hypothetical protein JHK87_049946 [Glycine soja]|nr:hypothetical protein JHK87_049946 [Glycine soja]
MFCSVWVARRPPGYAFIEFDDRRDALDAIQALDGVTALVGEDLQDDVAYRFPGVAAIAGPLHIVLLAMIHLMPMSAKRVRWTLFCVSCVFSLLKPEGVIIGQNSIVSPLTTSCLLLCFMPPQSSHLVASAYKLTKGSMSTSWLHMTFLLTVQERMLHMHPTYDLEESKGHCIVYPPSAKSPVDL